jgi:hypothetical protein
LLQGQDRKDCIQFTGQVPDGQKVLMVLGKIGDFLLNQCNGLKEIEDWEYLYGVLTHNYNKQISAVEDEWDLEEVKPANFNDLVWKVKVRFQAMHSVGLADIEGQKRTTAFTCSMMGIIPTTTIAESTMGSEECKIPRWLNPLRSPDIDRTQSLVDQGVPTKHTLLLNQSKKLSLKVGMLNSPGQGLGGAVRSFYVQFSAKKADAAAQTQQRSWKDVTLSICRNTSVRGSLVPADYDQQFFSLFEDDGPVEYKKSMDAIDEGRYIEVWSALCRESILKAMYNQINSAALSKAIISKEPTGNYQEFKEVVMHSQAIRTNSPWFLPTTITTPKAIHCLIYFVFLIGPGDAVDQDENRGLKNLEEVINGNGQGISVTEEPCHPAWENNRSFQQSVSRTALHS